MSICEDTATVEEAELRLCRVCNVPSMQSLPLYKPHIIAGELTTLAALLSYCANLQVLEEERFLPTHMCKRCGDLLTQVYEFKRTALRTDHLLRKRNAISSRAAISRSPSLADLRGQLEQADADDDTETDAIIESAGSDEYVYVLAETESLASNADSVVSNQQDQVYPVADEIPENEVHFESVEPNVEVFEVDYDLPEDYENEQAQSSIEADHSVKPRATPRRKSLNPALQCLVSNCIYPIYHINPIHIFL